MEHFPEFENDVEFTERLISEQSVFCLPATVSTTLRVPWVCGAQAQGYKEIANCNPKFWGQFGNSVCNVHAPSCSKYSV